jgi:charged multivesicular body protein 1
MGGAQSKKQPDLNEVLAQMRMKGKMFHRESQKCLKEKKTFVDKAKKCLQQGNEEGARLFLESANNKDSESMKYLKIANRLEALSAKVGGNFKTQDVSDNLPQLMNHLAGLTPFLDDAAEKMPLDLMYTKMAAFEQSYDQMTVKGKMVSEAIDNNLAEKGSVANVVFV